MLSIHMGVADDVSDRIRSNSDSDGYHVYRADRATREGSEFVGEVESGRFSDVLRRHRNACTAFEMITGAGYRDPAEMADTYSSAEHAGRVRTDVLSIATDLADNEYTCTVRLDTARPQLATITNGVERAQIEFDSSRVRWIPPDGYGEGMTTGE